jgi:hypothetical protein
LKILFCGVPETIYWAIQKNDPVFWDTDVLEGFKLLNPLALTIIDFDNSFDEGSASVMNVKSTAFVGTRKLAFLAPPDSSGKGPDRIVGRIADKITSFLKQLRTISRQSNIRASIDIAYYKDYDMEPRLIFPEPIEKVHIARWLWESAITNAQVQLACNEVVNPSLPVFEDLLVDALGALRDEDFRRSLLYSGISCEVATSIILDEAVKPLGKNDKIFAALSSRELKNKLQAATLYVLGRSLLDEDKSLYDEVIKLYDTRGKIAHSGTADTDSSRPMFEVSREGAKAGLSVAIRLVNWLGYPFSMPISGGFISHTRD